MADLPDRPAMPADAAAPEPSADPELAALLWLVAAGDHTAFRRLYDREAPLLFALALRVTANAALAEEALHEALTQLWRRSVQFRPEFGTPEGWLIAQVRQRAIESLRRRQRAGQPPDVFGRDADLPAGLKRLTATPETRRMRAALMTLDGRRRELLAHAFLDGMTSAELAQKLRLPIGTVKSWTRRSLTQLRTALDGAA